MINTILLLTAERFNEIMELWLPYAWPIRDEFLVATGETIYMLVISCLIGGLLGLILGIIMTVTGPNLSLIHI